MLFLLALSPLLCLPASSIPRATSNEISRRPSSFCSTAYKMLSAKSFVLITIHFDGEVCSPSALLLFFEEPIRALTHFCEPRANRMPALSDRQLMFGGKTIFQNRGAGDRNSTGMSEP